MYTIVCVDCGKDTESKSKQRKRCDECSLVWKRENAKRHYWKDAEASRAKAKERRLSDLESALKREREAHARRRDMYRDRRNALSREKYAEDPIKRREAHKRWRDANPERHRATLTKSNARQRMNPGYRVHGTVSNLIRLSISNKGGRSWEKLVGYSLEELMSHLERKFQPGMSWENYGMNGWHIDHIRPRASFTFETSDDPQFLECWALSNLQPLWAVDNMSKGAKSMEEWEAWKEAA